MSPLLARMLVDQERYVPEEAGEAYLFSLDSGPFDCGMTWEEEDWVDEDATSHKGPDDQKPHKSRRLGGTNDAEGTGIDVISCPIRATTPHILLTCC